MEKRKGQRENDKRVPFDSLCPKEFEAFDLRASVRANVKNRPKKWGSPQIKNRGPDLRAIAEVALNKSEAWSSYAQTIKQCCYMSTSHLLTNFLHPKL